MALTPQQNIMMSKIEKMRSLFIRELKKGKQVIVWSMNYDEKEMIDSFCLIENSDHSKMDDIIIQFVADCYDHESYSEALIAEMQASYDQSASLAGDNDWILKNWRFDPQKLSDRDSRRPASFLKMLQSMCEAVPSFPDKIIAVLTPKKNNDTQALKRWLNDAAEDLQEISNRVIISVVDSAESPQLNIRADAKMVGIISPELNMSEAITQMATAGNPANPDVQFRKCFFSMTEAVGKKSISGVSKWHDKAVEVAKSVKWKDMEAAAHLAAGSFMVSLKNEGDALRYFDDAIDKCNQLREEGHYMGVPMLIQGYGAKGATLLHQKKYEVARACYEEMAQLAVESNNYLQALEAWRLAAYTSKKAGDGDKAWEYNWKAVEAAEKLDEQTRPFTTLPYVGNELLELSPSFSKNGTALIEIENKMSTLLGADWQHGY